MLQTLGEMVWRYRCDLMLLSGRPSRLPAVAAILRETACLSPTRIVPLHSFRVGRWYPFRDARATISDPKTTAAVGAMICLLAEGHLPNFNFRPDLLKRSEEHTSELQSLMRHSYAVFCLKKKTHKIKPTSYTHS